MTNGPLSLTSVARDPVGMIKRIIATPLWFVAIWALWDLVVSVAGVPQALGPVLAVAVSAFVAIDPAHLFWPRSAQQVR